MQTVKGPVAPGSLGCLVYQVTLASGMIVTNPAMFGTTEEDQTEPQVVMTEDGRILVAPKTKQDAPGACLSS
jgi:hypothetical protein